MRKRQWIRRVFSMILCLCLLSELLSYPMEVTVEAAADSVTVLPAENAAPSEGCVFLGIPGSYLTDTQAVIDRINEIRLEACKEGVISPTTKKALTIEEYVPIKWSAGVEAQMRFRASEAGTAMKCLDSGHKRLNGKSIWQMNYPSGFRVSSEIIAYNWSTNVTSGIDQWYKEKDDWINQTSGAVTGHYTAMINPNNTYIGLASFYSSSVNWQNTTVAQLGSGTGLDETPMDAIENCVQMVEVMNSCLSSLSLPDITMTKEESKTLSLNAMVSGLSKEVEVLAGAEYASSDTSVVTIDEQGELVVQHTGTAVITAKVGDALTTTCTVTVEEKQDTSTSETIKAGMYNDFSYNVLDDGTVEITDYEGSAQEIRIPTTIDGKTVTKIGDRAFKDCSSLTSITIPEKVESIGVGAFANCSKLIKIEVADTNINYAVYDGCLYNKGLTQLCACPGAKAKVVFSQKITSIGDYAFYGCSGLTSIAIPEEVTSIGEYAFSECSSLVGITIPEKVTRIENCAFSGCSSLISIIIPEGVMVIGISAFSRCSSLISITIPEGVTNIGGQAFCFCSNLTSITIPEGVTSIGIEAFWGCSSLASITIPEGVTSIGGSAFDGCSSLTSITIPEKIERIGEGAFANCSKLIRIEVATENSNYAVYDGCLYNKDLTQLCACPGGKGKVVFSQKVTSIGNSAFLGCRSLTSIIIPEEVISIGNWAFYGCSSLTSITILEGVTSIESSAFYNCSSQLTIYGTTGSTAEQYANDNDITFQALNQSGTGNQGDQSSTGGQGSQSSTGNQGSSSNTGGQGNQSSTTGNSSSTVNPTNQGNQSATTNQPTQSTPSTHPPQSVTNVQTYLPALNPQIPSQPTTPASSMESKPQLPKVGTTKTLSSGKYLITKSSESKKTVTYLKPTYTKKATVTIPDTVKISGITYSVTEIAPRALKNNKKVKSIIIGKNITQIGQEAFYGCSNLKIIKIRTKKLKSVGKNFLNAKNAAIKTPKGYQKKYEKLFKSSVVK